MAKSKKESNYGDYADVQQNHKYPKEWLHTVNKGKKNEKIVVISPIKQLLTQVKTLGLVGKHAGSKSIELLKNSLRKASKKQAAINNFKKAIDKINETLPTDEEAKTDN